MVIGYRPPGESPDLDRLPSLLGGGNLVVLSGAGISAESGIPTFRGKEGYWVAGSREYQPQEMATRAMFARDPEAVWAWYLYRRSLCRRASPNRGHRALVDLERLLGDRFRLVTQNVDGLHIRAGSSPARTYQIHGSIDHTRCADACSPEVWPLPQELGRDRQRGQDITADEAAVLRCPRCGGWARPHVLWFDEYYDEEYYRFDSSIRAAASAAVLLVLGTSGSTNLPLQMGQYAIGTGALIVDVNLEENPFSRLALANGGQFLQGKCGEVLPAILERMGQARGVREPLGHREDTSKSRGFE